VGDRSAKRLSAGSPTLPIIRWNPSGFPLFLSSAEVGDRTQLLGLILSVERCRPVAALLAIFVATLANHLAAAAGGSRRCRVDRSRPDAPDRRPRFHSLRPVDRGSFGLVRSLTRAEGRAIPLAHSWTRSFGSSSSKLATRPRSQRWALQRTTESPPSWWQAAS
jgi:hypothetical protein